MKGEKNSFFTQADIRNPEILSKENLNKDFFLARKPFAHKGDFGHCLLIAGSYGKGGACVLSALSALRTGCGLLTVHIPKRLYNILQITVPEAMVGLDKDEEVFSVMPDINKYSALAIGPGLDTRKESKAALVDFLSRRTESEELKKIPLVLDADALNLFSTVKNFKDLLYDNIILTPHPKEFERLFGAMALKDKMEFLQKFCSQHSISIVLKGGVTTICTPTGRLFFNTIGNPGMATAGSGDVLTGIILGILSQGFSVEDSAKIGVYIHALAGDLAKENLGEKSMIARDIVAFLTQALK